MKALVCVRFVGADIQPFDAAALECALRLSDDVTVLSLCPPSAAAPLSSLTRLGCRRAVLLSDPVFAGSDTLATARILAAAAEKLGYDLIFCGRTSTEGETAQVGPMLATLLGLPLFPGVMQAENRDDPFVTLRGENGSHSITGKALLTVERAFPLRFPSIRSRRTEAEILDAHALGLDPAVCGLAGSPTRVVASRESRGGRRKCVFLPVGQLPALIDAARKQEKKETTDFPPSDEKLPLVLCVGREAEGAARAVGKQVEFLDETDPDTVAARIATSDPDAVLFPATDAGRLLAPRVAARLSRGLCADCTGLRVEGGRLLMTRPARGGTVVADILSVTRPAMATVRCTSTAPADVILAAGLGVKGRRADLLALGAKLGAARGASRALVDAGEAPYAEQIGLTGTRAACRVYLAVGISGAVQHTCALDGADVVIAVNPDKEARIFDEADYGVVATFDDLLHAFHVE